MLACGVPLGGGQRLQSSLTGNKAVKKDKNKNKKMLTWKTPGTSLDFWIQPQWLFGVWYNFFFSADDHDINTTVAKMMDQKCFSLTIRNVLAIMIAKTYQWGIKQYSAAFIYLFMLPCFMKTLIRDLSTTTSTSTTTRLRERDFLSSK